MIAASMVVTVAAESAAALPASFQSMPSSSDGMVAAMAFVSASSTSPPVSAPWFSEPRPFRSHAVSTLPSVRRSARDTASRKAAAARTASAPPSALLVLSARRRMRSRCMGRTNDGLKD